MGSVSAQQKLDAAPELPEFLEYLWVWYLQLSRARTYGMGGPDPIRYVDIQAWAALTGQHPFPHEVDALLQIDTAACNAAHEQGS